jgi:hypothetical protein
MAPIVARLNATCAPKGDCSTCLLALRSLCIVLFLSSLPVAGGNPVQSKHDASYRSPVLTFETMTSRWLSE